MSNKKQQKKKGGKVKQKDLQKERLELEQARKQQQRQDALQRINVLERSGLLDGYQNLLRAICKNGLPETNIFEFAAQQMLKYEKKLKIKDGKRSELQKSLDKQGSKQKSERQKYKPPYEKKQNKEEIKSVKK